MAKLITGADFTKKCAHVALSDAAYRTHHEVLTWLVCREVEGPVDRRMLFRATNTGDPEGAALELVAAGFWEDGPDGWIVRDTLPSQVSPAEARDQRLYATVKRGRQRERQHAGSSSSVTMDEGLEIANQVLARDGGRCLRCATTHQLTIDHIRAVINGGTWELDNLQTLCRSCNAWKHDREIDFRDGSALPPARPRVPTQPLSGEELARRAEGRRVAERNRKRRQRAHGRGDHGLCSFPACPDATPWKIPQQRQQ